MVEQYLKYFVGQMAPLLDRTQCMEEHLEQQSSWQLNDEYQYSQSLHRAEVDDVGNGLPTLILNTYIKSGV